VGRTAEFYYRTGLKPTRSQMDQFTRQATELLRQRDLPGLRRILKKNGRVSESAPESPLTDVREAHLTRELGASDET
jgi:hypothetical protein